jgi:hypothetical protein
MGKVKAVDDEKKTMKAEQRQNKYGMKIANKGSRCNGWDGGGGCWGPHGPWSIQCYMRMQWKKVGGRKTRQRKKRKEDS